LRRISFIVPLSIKLWFRFTAVSILFGIIELLQQLVAKYNRQRGKQIPQFITISPEELFITNKKCEVQILPLFRKSKI